MKTGAKGFSESAADLCVSINDWKSIEMMAERHVEICDRRIIGELNLQLAEFYYNAGVRKILHLELYPRTIALALQDGFRETWTRWLQEQDQRRKKGQPKKAQAAAALKQVGAAERKKEQTDVSMRSVDLEEEQVGTPVTGSEQPQLGESSRGAAGKEDTTMLSNPPQEPSFESTTENSTLKASAPRKLNETTLKDSTSEYSSNAIADASSFDESNLDASTPKKPAHTESPAAETESQEEEHQSEGKSDITMKSV